MLSSTPNFPTQLYITPGTDTWIAPITGTVTVQVWGGGGGGASGGGNGNIVFGYSGGGGGGGGTNSANIDVIAGDTYTITVGGGGQGATGAPTQGASGIAGGTSSFAFGSTIDVQATGGSGGSGGNATENYGGAGGSAGGGSGSIGAVKDGVGGSGGNGANGAALGGAGGVGGGGNGANGSGLGGGGGGGGGNTTPNGSGGSGGTGAAGEVAIAWASDNPPPETAVTSSSNSGSPGEEGALLQNDSASYGPTISTTTVAPVSYADGVATIAATDLHSSGFGFPWGQTRTWSNGPGYATGSDNGNGWVNTYIPHLVQADGSTSNALIYIANGDTAYYYDLVNGVYQPSLDDLSTLTYNNTNDKFTLIDTQGDQIVFNGFGTSRPNAQRGEFASFTGPNGTQMAVTSYTSDGHIAEMQRSGAVNGTTTTESWLYSYLPSGNANAGLLSNVTLRTQVNGGSWNILQEVAYTYFDGTQEYGGNLGDLMTASVEDGSGHILSTSYYRYYTPGQANGYTNGLEYVFNPASYERLTAALQCK